jgi:hypothetical protein
MIRINQPLYPCESKAKSKDGARVCGGGGGKRPGGGYEDMKWTGGALLLQQQILNLT